MYATRVPSLLTTGSNAPPITLVTCETRPVSTSYA